MEFFLLLVIQMCRRDLILTGKCIYLIGREPTRKGLEKVKAVEVIKRKLSFHQISHISLSTLQVFETVKF